MVRLNPLKTIRSSSKSDMHLFQVTIDLVLTIKEIRLLERNSKKHSDQKDQESLNKLVLALTKNSKGKRWHSVMVDGQNMQ